MKYFITLAFYILTISSLSAQQECFMERLKRGNEAFANQDYVKAKQRWNAALNNCKLTESQKNTLWSKIAEAEAALKPKDKDGDGWNDTEDGCPSQAGTVKGCPDADGDGFADWNDDCPKDFGKLKGCPVSTFVDFEESLNTGSSIKMVAVKGGTFQMGSNEYDDEKPIHEVTVSDYHIGRYEITQKQWRAIMGTDPSYFKNCDDCPVEQVSWNDAQDFLSKLNSKTGKKYRLPTEAEWEYAARGGNQSKGYTYSGSNNLDEVAWYSSNAESKTHAEAKKANELGIYGMSGNVWEWCNDWYDKSYYGSSSSNNPTGPSSGSDRVYRGGSWGHGSVRCRVANRYYDTPGNRYTGLGFRVCLPVR